MNIGRVGVLLGKELLQGPKNYIFTMAVVLPIVLSLVVSLAFGTLFAEKPRLGIVDEGGSRLVAAAGELSAIDTREYGTVAEVREAAESGAVDIGIVLPPDFDNSVQQGDETEIGAFIWGESLAKNRTILGITIVNLVRDVAGQESPVAVEAVALGEGEDIPWSARLFPFIVLMAVLFGGSMLPATAVVYEKEKKTLLALVTTPATLVEVFVAKGLVGVLLSLFAGIAILGLNGAFGTEPMLLVLVLALGAVMAAAFGLILGALMKDFTTLFAVWKSAGILLFAPAIVYLFPQIPEWVGRLFPTYYLVQPIVQMSQQSAGWSDIAANVYILLGLNVVLLAALVLVLRRVKQYAV